MRENGGCNSRYLLFVKTPQLFCGVFCARRAINMAFSGFFDTSKGYIGDIFIWS